MRIDLASLFPFEEQSVVSTVSYEGGLLIGHRVAEAHAFPLRITHLKDRVLEFSGSGSIVLMFQCDRCLKEFPLEIPFEISRKADASKSVDDEGEEVLFFPDDSSVDIDLLIEDEVLLNLPVRTLCREDCKGLCPVCGKDLNRGACGCNVTTVHGALQEALMKALQQEER